MDWMCKPFQLPNIGNDEYLLSIEYCEVVSNDAGTSVHGILAEIAGANIIGTLTPSIASSTTGVTMSFNQINGSSAEWGDWDHDAAPIFMDSGDPMECFTVTLICDAAPTSVTFAGSSNNTNIGGGFQAINGRWACVETVIFPPPVCDSDWTPPTYCPGSKDLIDLNLTTNSVGVFTGSGVDSQTAMFDPTGLIQTLFSIHSS